MCSAPQAIIAARSSTTTKSRMFSQTSANDRGRRVPSPEYSQMSRWIGAASGSMALRVRKRCLPQLLQARANGSERRLDLHGCGAARNIVLLNHSTEFERGRKIFG